MRAKRLLLSIGLLLALDACGTVRPGAPVARVERDPANPPTATAPAPANTPELDPANVERRFGVAEARQREAEAKRRKQDGQKRVDVAPPPENKR